MPSESVKNLGFSQPPMQPFGSLESRLVDFAGDDKHARQTARRPRGAHLKALEGACDAVGAPLPYLPGLVRDRIVDKLDACAKSSLMHLWGRRLSPPARQEMLTKAAEAYGFASSAGAFGWQAHLNTLASSKPAPAPCCVEADVTLAKLLDGSLAPWDAVKRSPDHREVVMRAIEQDGDVLKHACDNLKNDCQIVTLAVGHGGTALRYASHRLQDDRDLVIHAVKAEGTALLFASARLQLDREVVMLAVTQNSRALEFAASPFKNDREIVMRAVEKNGKALQWANVALKNDREVVLCAIKQSVAALSLAGPALQADPKISNYAFACASLRTSARLGMASGLSGWRASSLCMLMLESRSMCG